ncbi:Delta(12) fatty acid desaturase-like protein [Hapsidospora chrysogenum ATCC 11550]|uniref:Delta(12) fatty acid desaturase-like protein n=1 Tax=Hapsidospora chrysogenum (strain ATCC 11550 / CBS 779.69 / DSM 880 / IAM 14645 / JCM 23072 / IMI 49137) TaxID=857340 RepID=A0A086TCE5_HAPC1|nr:Delta(12) fatty acid desaturase-like protein [Hapsidospora chrysogenum ATCC 11550]
MITTVSTTQIRNETKPVKAEPQFPDINTLRRAIPKHCFEPPVARSLGYLVRDVAMIGALGWAALTYIPTIPDATARTAAWVLYGFVQGLICTGLWILGHEAGHGAFSLHPRLNDVVGFFSHSALLVPYYSWKFSHHRHHMYTGHMEKDMAFVPRTRAQYLQKVFYRIEFLEDTPAYQLVTLLFHQLFAWQTYLTFNVSSGRGSLQKQSPGLFGQSHFDPRSAVFRRSEAPYIVLSDIGLCLTMGCLYMLSGVVGWQTTMLLYAQPYFWVHHWLIAITYLHHTHMEVPHYEPQNWTFVKGALATVDREFGFIGRSLFHGIIEHHVIHHLFPRIPFYYAEEATEAIKPILGDLYRRDDRSFLGQLWTNFTQCKFVEADEALPGVLHWADVKSQ